MPISRSQGSALQQKIVAELVPEELIWRNMIECAEPFEDLFNTLLGQEQVALARPERARLFEQIAAEILGFGPLQPLLEDETITEIMVNGYKSIYIERAGKIHNVPVTFESNEHLMRIIDRIVSPLGRRIDESPPIRGRAPAGRLARQRHHPTDLAGRSHAHHSKVLQVPLSDRRLIELAALRRRRSSS